MLDLENSSLSSTFLTCQTRTPSRDISDNPKRFAGVICLAELTKPAIRSIQINATDLTHAKHSGNGLYRASDASIDVS